jgi:hypothetical protein
MVEHRPQATLRRLAGDRAAPRPLGPLNLSRSGRSGRDHVDDQRLRSSRSQRSSRTFAAGDRARAHVAAQANFQSESQFPAVVPVGAVVPASSRRGLACGESRHCVCRRGHVLLSRFRRYQALDCRAPRRCKRGGAVAGAGDPGRSRRRRCTRPPRPRPDAESTRAERFRGGASVSANAVSPIQSRETHPAPPLASMQSARAGIATNRVVADQKISRTERRAFLADTRFALCLECLVR